MAAAPLLRDTNMAVVTSRENTLLTIIISQTECAHENLDSYSKSELSITQNTFANHTFVQSCPYEM